MDESDDFSRYYEDFDVRPDTTQFPITSPLEGGLGNIQFEHAPDKAGNPI